MRAVALDLSRESDGPDRWKQTTWLVLGTAAYFVLGLLGRSTIAEGEVLSLVWPAAGAAMLLYGLTSVRGWWAASALVAAATITLNLLTGATGTQAGIFWSPTSPRPSVPCSSCGCCRPTCAVPGVADPSSSSATSGRS